MGQASRGTRDSHSKFCGGVPYLPSTLKQSRRLQCYRTPLSSPPVRPSPSKLLILPLLSPIRYSITMRLGWGCTSLARGSVFSCSGRYSHIQRGSCSRAAGEVNLFVHKHMHTLFTSGCLLLPSPSVAY